MITDNQYFNYARRRADEVFVGLKPLGGDNPIRLQSMTTTPTADAAASAEQCMRIIRSGADYVRLTAQGMREVDGLREIERLLRERNVFTPLIADVHFNPRVADAAAEVVEGVRINPGNYVDAARRFLHLEYTDAEYAEELQKIRLRLIPFLNICRQHHTAVRIGVNHGSLSDRIMSRYGDTPEGIVESCMEFLRVCKEVDFGDVVLSIKASNPAVMVRSVRLLVDRMDKEDMHYPLHLGVTEAGEGDDGRIISSVGIGALLQDGMGDTIRVSLSEEPEREIPVARKLCQHILLRRYSDAIHARLAPDFDYLNPTRRITRKVGIIGGGQVPVTVIDREERETYVPAAEVKTSKADFTAATLAEACHPVRLTMANLDDATLDAIKADAKAVVIAECQGLGHPHATGQATRADQADQIKAIIHTLWAKGVDAPVIAHMEYDHNANTIDEHRIECAADFGALLLDGLLDGIWITDFSIPSRIVCKTMFQILQAAGARLTGIRYISCPGCGRTLYDLQSTVHRIKQATSSLPPMKIAVMGCIVNGPGEMADADYGYVGAARGKVSLYRGKECVRKNIPEEDAVKELLALIKSDREA